MLFTLICLNNSVRNIEIFKISCGIKVGKNRSILGEITIKMFAHKKASESWNYEYILLKLQCNGNVMLCYETLHNVGSHSLSLSHWVYMDWMWPAN